MADLLWSWHEDVAASGSPWPYRRLKRRQAASNYAYLFSRVTCLEEERAHMQKYMQALQARVSQLEMVYVLTDWQKLMDTACATCTSNASEIFTPVGTPSREGNISTSISKKSTANSEWTTAMQQPEPELSPVKLPPGLAAQDSEDSCMMFDIFSEDESNTEFTCEKFDTEVQAIKPHKMAQKSRSNGKAVQTWFSHLAESAVGHVQRGVVQVDVAADCRDVPVTCAGHGQHQGVATSACDSKQAVADSMAQVHGVHGGGGGPGYAKGGGLPDPTPGGGGGGGGDQDELNKEVLLACMTSDQKKFAAVMEYMMKDVIEEHFCD